MLEKSDTPLIVLKDCEIVPPKKLPEIWKFTALGNQAVGNRDIDLAIRNYQKALELAKSNSTIFRKEIRTLEDRIAKARVEKKKVTLLTQVQNALNQKKFARARQLSEQGLKQFPNESQFIDFLLKTKFELALTRANDGKSETELIAACAELLSLHQELWEENWKPQRAKLESALSDLAQKLQQLAELKLKNRKFEDALTLLKWAMRCSPNSQALSDTLKNTYYEQASYLLVQSKYKRAKDAVTQASNFFGDTDRRINRLANEIDLAIEEGEFKRIEWQESQIAQIHLCDNSKKLFILDSNGALWSQSIESSQPRKLKTDGLRVTRFAASSDGTRVAYLHNSGLSIHNTNSSQNIRLDSSVAFSTVQFCGSGKHVLTGTSSGKIRVFDSRKGNIVCETELAEEESVTTITLSQNTMYLAAGTERGAIFVFEFGDRLKKSLAIKTAHPSGITRLFFRSDMQRLIVSMSVGKAWAWEFQGRKHRQLAQISLKKLVPTGGEFYKESARIVGHDLGKISVIDAISRKTIKNWNNENQGLYSASLASNRLAVVRKKIIHLFRIPESSKQKIYGESAGKGK